MAQKTKSETNDLNIAVEATAKMKVADFNTVNGPKQLAYYVEVFYTLSGFLGV